MDVNREYLCDKYKAVVFACTPVGLAVHLYYFALTSLVSPRLYSMSATVLIVQICGVSVLRAGETMEPALCGVCKDIRLGKILIQTNLDSGEPEVSCLPYTC